MDADENCKNYLRHLLDKAITDTNFLCQRSIASFFRNKNAAYWRGVDNNGKVMMPLLKDMGGDKRSPINGKLKGVFLDVTLRSGSLPDKSPFGEIRVVFPIEGLYDDTTNLYFTDFYCKRPNRKGVRNHFVTLVLTKKNSIADDFCKKKLLQLNPETNRFFRRKNGSGEIPSFTTIANPPMHVEIFYTESVNQRELEERFGTRRVKRYPTGIIGKGSSTWGGVPKDTRCPVCDSYETSSIKQPLDIEVVPDEVHAISTFRNYNSPSTLNTDSTISRRRGDLTVSSARHVLSPTATSLSMGRSSGIVDSVPDFTRRFRDVYISPAIQSDEIQIDRGQSTNSVAREYTSNDITSGLQGSCISTGSRVSDMLASRRDVSHETGASSPYADIEYVSPFTSKKYSSAYTGSGIGSPSADKGNVPHYTGRQNISSYPKREIISFNTDKSYVSPYTDRETVFPYSDRSHVFPYNSRGKLSATTDKGNVSPITDRESRFSNTARGIISPHPNIDRYHGSPFTDRENVFPYTERGNISPYTKKEVISPYADRSHVFPRVKLSATTDKEYVSPITGRESRSSNTSRAIISAPQEQTIVSPDSDRDHGSPLTDRGNVFPCTERGNISTYPQRDVVSPYTYISHVSPDIASGKFSTITDREKVFPYTDRSLGRETLSDATDKRNVSPITDRESRYPNPVRRTISPYQEQKFVSPVIDRDHGSPFTDRGNVFANSNRGNISTYPQREVLSPYTDSSNVFPYNSRVKLSAITDRGNVSPITDRESRFSSNARGIYPPYQEQKIVSSVIDRDHGSPLTDRGNVFPNSERGGISTYPQREAVSPYTYSSHVSLYNGRGSVSPNTDRSIFSSSPKRKVPPYTDRGKLPTASDMVNFSANFRQLRSSPDLERGRDSPSTDRRLKPAYADRGKSYLSFY